jgi:hypothetical protein
VSYFHQPETIARWIHDASEARSRAIDEDAEIDEFWCAFDNANDIKLAIANPCFESWLMRLASPSPCAGFALVVGWS